MRGGHGSTGDAVGSIRATNPGRLDIASRGKEIEHRTVVGKVRDAPVRVNGSNSNGGGSRGRRKVAGVCGRVAGSNGGDDTSSGGGIDGSVERGRVATAEGQVDNGSTLAAVTDDILDSPVETIENDGSGGRAALENLDAEEGGLLGHTIGSAADGAGDVSTVSIGVFLITRESSIGLGGTAAKVIVSIVDASVDNVCKGVGSSHSVVKIRSSAWLAVRNRSKTPRSRVLGGRLSLTQRRAFGLLDEIDLPDLILFNNGDLFYVSHGRIFW